MLTYEAHYVIQLCPLFLIGGCVQLWLAFACDVRRSADT